MAEPILKVSNLSVMAGKRQLLRDVSCSIDANQIFALIGPSGAGKSTLLKSLNRLSELTSGLKVEGQVYFHEKPVYASNVDADALRVRMGILFQQPVVFPKSIYQNVLFGVKYLGQIPKNAWPETAEQALREAALWDEVKDRLSQSALKLSVGQQQRLCLARALATQPEVILMDEPTSALDPKSTEAIEDLVLEIKRKRTVVLVTHNLRQARKVADKLAFVGVRDGAGQILCHGNVDDVLANTELSEVEDYVCCQ